MAMLRKTLNHRQSPHRFLAIRQQDLVEKKFRPMSFTRYHCSYHSMVGENGPPGIIDSPDLP